MQTVQFQCGKCGKLMAVSIEHLGTQVHCPHCMGIVEAPAAVPSPEPKPAPEIKGFADSGEKESIFGGGHEESGDDIFGGPPRPLVEMPSAPPQPIAPPPISAEVPDPPVTLEPLQEAPAPVEKPEPETWKSAEADENEIPVPREVRPRAKKSMLVPTLLMVLVPYAVITTVVIIILLLRKPYDPLERLPDPNPAKGGPKRVDRVDPGAPLSPKGKTSLNRPIQMGDIEITPLRILLTTGGDLAMDLKLVNVSRDLEFIPLPQTFAFYSPTKPLPYMFIDAVEKLGEKKGRLYGAEVEYWKGTPGKGEKVQEGPILPGKEIMVRLITFNIPRNQNAIENLMKDKATLVWRVHVRRGFVQVKGRDVSATAVIGVQFDTTEIDKKKAS